MCPMGVMRNQEHLSLFDLLRSRVLYGAGREQPVERTMGGLLKWIIEHHQGGSAVACRTNCCRSLDRARSQKTRVEKVCRDYRQGRRRGSEAMVGKSLRAGYRDGTTAYYSFAHQTEVFCPLIASRLVGTDAQSTQRINRYRP